MAEREHQRGHEGSKARRRDEAMSRRKSPLGGDNEQREEPVKHKKDFRI